MILKSHLQPFCHGRFGTIRWFKKTSGKEKMQGIGVWLVVSTQLKNISQIGTFPQVGVKTKKDC